MDEQDWKRLRGLKRLIHDGVEHGANFVEKHHRHAADKPFDVLESVESIGAPTKVVRAIHDGVLSVTYGSIRAINRVTEVANGWVVDRLAEANEVDEEQPHDEASDDTESAPGTDKG
jgi:hypothetical protein